MTIAQGKIAPGTAGSAASVSAPRTTEAAVVSSANAPFQIREVELSSPRLDEVVVRLEASGMCHADLAARAGHLPFPLPGVLGHEGVGRIVEIGPAVTDVRVGDRVVISFTWCGHCPACRRGAPAYCQDWPQLNLVGGCRSDGSLTLSCCGAPMHGPSLANPRSRG